MVGHRKAQSMVKQFFGAQVFRFIVLGGTNTLVTYVIFILLGLVIAPGVAYTVAFVAGLGWVVFGSSRFVFRSTWSTKRLLLFTGWYLFIYAIGQVLVQVLAPRGVYGLALTSLIVLLVTTPLTFVGGKYIFRRAPQPDGSHEERQTNR